MRNHLTVAGFLLALAAGSVAWGQAAGTDAPKAKAPEPVPARTEPLKKMAAAPKAARDRREAGLLQQMPTVKRLPVVIWNDPAPIKEGQALTKRELDAISEVPGRFVYRPSAGYVPPRGSYTLTVWFLPVDSYQYESVTTTAVLSVE
ncbi:MAG: hypothetical protein WBQ94_06160 [Terracidiphilus sp.]